MIGERIEERGVVVIDVGQRAPDPLLIYLFQAPRRPDLLVRPDLDSP